MVVGVTRSADELPTVALTEVATLDVAAPSGLVIDDEGALCVVADDELTLRRYGSDGRPRGRVTLFAGDAPLPEEPAARKRRKPDLEALARLPGGRLLALGSGSTAARRRGALVEPDGAVRVVALGPLYDALAARLPELNIEGATVAGGVLLLFQRGNGAGAASAVVRLTLAAVEEALARGAPLDASMIDAVAVVELGALAGCALGFTDATPLDRSDGRVLFAAAAEGGGSTYDDGAVTGSVLGLLEPDGRARLIARLAPVAKIEGIALAPDGRRLYAVADPDDPRARSPLYEATLDAVALRPE